MDKRVIFAVAGSGKTSYIVKSLSAEKRSLIVTYTNGNYANISKKIAAKFRGIWPNNITLMTYFQFLYRFCYKPLLSDVIGARGIIYEQNPNSFAKQKNLNYYLSPSMFFYSNRLAFFLEKSGSSDEIKARISKYYDEFIIDEVQDISGRDFNFLETLMDTNVNLLFVGDFYQHTFDTSRDGNVNQSLFEDQHAYVARFLRHGVMPDTTTLLNSWRCGNKICNFISTNLGINISSRKVDDTKEISFITEDAKRKLILSNPNIVKLHYRECHKYGSGHRNWGDTKGEDCYYDVCVLLNPTTMQKYNSGKLSELAMSTRNKLYVAITRAHGNVYLIEE